MKYYIIAGEASGDLHGSNLIHQIKLKDAPASIRCWGGDLMQNSGATLVKHYRDLAFMGFVEVMKNLPTIFKNLAFCKEDILQFQPDILVLIDYPGFNLRIAKWAKQQNIKIAYYISPQVWAWKASRVKQMKQDIDKMICILPFEKDYYKTVWNWNVEYVGHPLTEVIENWLTVNSQRSTVIQTKNIAVLPGSRKQEIQKKLPIMLSVAKHFTDYEFVVAKAPGIEDEFYETFLSLYPNVSSVKNDTYHLLSKSSAALVTSGTATLETALFGVPEVVCYKANNISYQIGKRVVKIKFISLVNLIMDKLVVKELIQDDLNAENLKTELEQLLFDDVRKQQLELDYKELWNKLYTDGSPSEKAATIIYKMIK
ncbi:MAG: lipid-A-disaccharide synthase [Chitinophagaceae bacterium]|nr:lipid-A-disaccharide synthase [Chitinophagaceae bacterium]